MFLTVTVRRNPGLIVAAATMLKSGIIPPNTYVIDKDGVIENAERIRESAERVGVSLYFMTKQIGRNPDIARSIAAHGIERAVAVDFDEAVRLHQSGIRIGHIGHLVQVPSGFVERAVEMGPEVITCFSLAKARQVSDAAVRAGRVQDILLRVVGRGDSFSPAQKGGIELKELALVARGIRMLPGVRLCGVTSFPCLTFNQSANRVEPTANAKTLREAASLLKGEGFEVTQVNGSSITCSSTIPLMKAIGITHAEPGHAFTGTTPLHAVSDEPERPAMVYATEVSHVFRGRAYCFGGGFYPRSHVKQALVGDDPGQICERRFEVSAIPPSHIDYYGTIIDASRRVKVGDAAVFAFRTQVFATRAYVAVLEGLSSGQPRYMGLYDARGNPVEIAEKPVH